ncbi:MAG: 3-isopropylmalate dehydratase small subunit [Pseudomonadota bacterium]|nr:3-isopropylmalate dehydratase small subunit [Pseudomonadota bacterium]
MSERTIEGIAAPLPISNLDTDQIMPKQFLRGIDKAGLDKGLLYDLRFDATREPRRGFVLNRSEYANCCVLIGGENFGCGSSREHAVWGLLQYGIKAIVAPSFGEIFYSNAMNNRLLLASVTQGAVDGILSDVSSPLTNRVTIDIHDCIVSSRNHAAHFSLSARHHRMFIEGLDLVGSSLAERGAIAEFEQLHWAKQPWLKAVATVTRNRLSADDDQQ